jgi:hypothetical protein
MTPVYWKDVVEGETYLFYRKPASNVCQTSVALGTATFSNRDMLIDPTLYVEKIAFASYKIKVRTHIQNSELQCRTVFECKYATDIFLLTEDEVSALIITLLSEEI